MYLVQNHKNSIFLIGSCHYFIIENNIEQLSNICVNKLLYKYYQYYFPHLQIPYLSEEVSSFIVRFQYEANYFVCT